MTRKYPHGEYCPATLYEELSALKKALLEKAGEAFIWGNDKGRLDVEVSFQNGRYLALMWAHDELVKAYNTAKELR